MSDRKRVFAFIAYPDDGLRKDWVEVLRSLHCSVAISPLHQPDKVMSLDESEFHTDKKAHYHVMLFFDGVRTFNQVNDMLSKLKPHITNAFEVYSPSGYIRYLVHFDDPDKEQFGDHDIELMNCITCLGSARDSVQLAFSVGDFDAYKVITEILQFVEDNYLCEFNELYTYLKDNPTWLYVMNKYPCKSVYSLLSSNRYTGKRS